MLADTLRNAPDSSKADLEFFSQLGPENEKLGRLCPDAFSRLLEMGVFQALVPSQLAGSQFGAGETLQLVEDLSFADPSTGWVAMAIGFCTGAAATYLPDSALDAIFGPSQLGLVAGAGAPTGVARKVSGGYEVTGQWRYGSGILHASWAHCGLVIDEGASAGPEAVRKGGIAYIPMDRVSLSGNWNVIGLKATGSVDYSIEGVFVPEEFVISSAAPVWRRGNRIFAQSFTLPSLIGHTGWAMGVTRRLLEELSQYVREAGTKPGSPASDSSYHEQFARQQARTRAARRLAVEAWGHADAVLQSGEKLGTREITEIRLALCHVTEVAADAAYFAYRIGGGVTLRDGLLQRLCKDILAGAQHATSSPSVYQSCGRELGNLAPGEEWVVNSLRPA